MLPKEIIKQVRRIEIKTGKLVNDIFAGQYESVFKGRGMEFSEVREYQPGDDIRSIDWNVTARFGHPFVKKYTEERELTCILLVDASSSQNFGSQDKLKSELAAEISALLALSAVGNNDKVGLIMFTDRVEKFLPPKKGKKHILRIIREMLYFKPANKTTKIEAALDHLNEVIKRKSIVFLISDFFDKGYEKALRVTGRRHDLICVNIKDPRELRIPKAGMVDVIDQETGQRFTLDTMNAEYQNKLSAKLAGEEEALCKFLKLSGIDFIKILCGQSYVEPFVKFFQLRARRFR
ncbi:MAG: DUF58 domain-containing protein [bacterium]